MYKSLFIIVILIITPVSANAFDKWTTLDTTLQTVALSFLYVDYRQTMELTQNHDDNFKEKNNILGEYPSRDKVNAYFMACAIGHTAIAIVLPKPYRNIWQMIWIGIEYDVTRKNANAGIKINWKFY